MEKRKGGKERERERLSRNSLQLSATSSIHSYAKFPIQSILDDNCLEARLVSEQYYLSLRKTSSSLYKKLL
jgi:hypothetical protein